MIVLGIYGSPRKGGNTDQLLDRALEGARSEGADIRKVYVRKLSMSGCIECGGCDETGRCVVKDDMQEVYPLFEEAQAIFLASPIFFYGVTAQAKALIDRAQAMWAKKILEKPKDQWKRHDGGRGYFIAVGATRGKNLFEGARLVAKYFFDALDMSYDGELLFWEIEKKSDAKERPEILEQAFAFGKQVVQRG
ncbi:MAG: flavodoxin family protein [Deltaproteobacteria bacterium]|nr:flavodoxin family protein [Deltaproteobacteria bacterium]MBW1950686.1 flavodoxin family protein [Deltaproteobacteria bacterium]RLB37913.1 MAG: flavodoxin family protein [Deltaproteobacteria bacterium]